jgi:ribosomal protein S12 methylthiotransferase
MSPKNIIVRGGLRLFVASLGCPKNLVDTEWYLASLRERFGAIGLTDDPCEAHIILVNTCAFIEPAVSESIETILGLAQEKAKGQSLVVTGCLVWRYGHELEGLLPEVDLFFHGRDPRDLGAALAEAVSFSGTVSGRALEQEGISARGRFRVTHPWQRYVKIAEGCSNRCTYCLIPRIRGALVCRRPESIVSEIRALERDGGKEVAVKEITIVAQDVTAYKSGDTDLVDLLERIVEESSVPWIRLLYLYPERLSSRLVEFMASESRICPYFDIPIQHASDRILRRMGRPYGFDLIREKIDLIRAIMPDAALRTTVITGFPGESEDDFSRLLDGVEELRFDHLGCFTYWDEEGCAASRLSGKVPKEVAEGRRDQVMELQKKISAERNRRFVGRIMDVLVDGRSQETELLLSGRSRYQAPEIDGQVYITSGEAIPGEFFKVRITEAHEYDLVGEIVTG